MTERPERTARGYRRFRCRECGKQYNKRSGGLLNYSVAADRAGRVVVMRGGRIEEAGPVRSCWSASA